MKKRYKILSIILALVIALGSIVTISIFSSSAETFTDENGIEWTVTENYPGWAISNVNKSQMVGDIVFPEYYKDKLIVAINGSSGIFANCTGLTSITLPDSIEFINGSAFKGCTGLTSVNLGNGITHIGHNTFKDCTGLTSITIPDSVKVIDESAFKGCTGLTSITIPDSVKVIEEYAFGGCTGITSVKLGVGVTAIETGTFNGCTGLTSITIPDGVTTLSGFSGCINLKTISIPDNVTTIENSAFAGCTSLTSITIPNSVTKIGNNAFNGCTELTSVTIPNSVTKIGNNAFKGCTGLTSITIPDSVKVIEQYAFDGCTGITSVKLGVGVTAIETGTFKGCYNLSNVEFNKENIKYIAKDAFPSSLGISAKPNYPNTTFVDDNGISWSLIGNKTGYIVRATDSSTINGDITIPDEYNGIPITELHPFSFYNCTGLTSVIIPESITVVDGFSGCTGLTSVIIPDGVTTLSGFSGCTNLKTISIPDSVTTIENSAFAGCTSLTSITIPNSVTKIGNNAFRDCTGLASITIPDSVTTIDGCAFEGCTGLTGELIIPDSVTEIGSYAFYNCRKLTSLRIGTGLKNISLGAFESCGELTSITIPDTVRRIEERAFSGCQRAFKNGLTIGKNVEYVGENAFSYCGNIDTLTVETPNTSNIHITAFYADTFNSLVVEDTVKEIDSVILSSNTKFETVTLGSNITNITDNAFFGNSNMSIQTTTNASTVIDYAEKNNIPYEFVNLADVDKKVTFEATCDKPGYEFTVYRVAELEAGSNPYFIRYDSLITDIEDEIFEGDSTALLSELDKVDSNLLTEVVGTYNTDVDGSSKLFEDLPAGIYYVRATNFPANVYSVQNSVFALPYYDSVEEWIYEITPIPLATKVDESNPEIIKTITNSTKDNVNFTDVSLGDTVNFEIEASRVGSANIVESKDFRLKSYVVSDIMESGFTLNQDSFVVTLEDIDGNTIATLENTTDYVVNVIASDGADTTFTVSLTPEYLQKDEFYSSANVVIAYSAVLNKYSTREFDGNYNTATNLTYSNKTNVSATVEGNTVYAYTFGIEVNKYDDAGTPLAGSQFALYLNEDDAKANKNAIATGTSTDTGKVEFYTEDENVIRLASGTYYIVETKATESYNRYTDVIPVTITVEYGETEVNGTYIESAPENGIQLVEVKNSKVIIPNTGGNGAMYSYIIALAFAILAVTLVVLKKRNTKKATAAK